MPDRLLSAYQVADLVGATPGAVVEWVQKGLLAAQPSPDGPIRISQEALVQFLKARGQEVEPILARLGAAGVGEEESPAADAELPRLDLAEYALAAPLPQASRSESIERMFPLDPVATRLREARPHRAPVAAGGIAEPAPDEAEEWPPADEEQAQDEAAPQELSEPMLTEPPDQSNVPLDETEPPSEGEEVPAAAPEVAGAAEAAVALVREALVRRATHIHITSTATGLAVALRIDGLLHEAARCGVSISAQAIPAAMQQLLDMVGTRHADPCRPSAGQVDLLVDDREVAVSVTTCPTTFGQRMVVSLADPQAPPASLSALGLEEAEQHRLAQVLAGPSGLVLLGARPGTERTAALKAMVSAMQPANRSLVVVTHQPAAPLAGLTPIVVSTPANFSVAQAVRAAAQQDADGIIVPDIRDRDTIPALLEAAEAGRLVLAATSSPSAASTVAMLLEAGLESVALANSLKAAVTTATVRTLCPHCRRPAAPDDETLAALGLMREEVGQAFAAGGCPECFNTGYCGLMGCSSAMRMEERLAAVFRGGPSRAELAEAIEQAGARPLLRVGLDLVREGLTTLEELARCLPR